MFIIKEQSGYKLMADTSNGVYETDDFSYEDIHGKTINVKPEDQNEFFKDLADLGTGEVIATNADPAIYNKIKKEYGIQKF